MKLKICQIFFHFNTCNTFYYRNYDYYNLRIAIHCLNLHCSCTSCRCYEIAGTKKNNCVHILDRLMNFIIICPAGENEEGKIANAAGIVHVLQYNVVTMNLPLTACLRHLVPKNCVI